MPRDSALRFANSKIRENPRNPRQETIALPRISRIFADRGRRGPRSLSKNWPRREMLAAKGVGSQFRPLNAPECEPASWRNRLPTPFWQRPPENKPVLGQALRSLSKNWPRREMLAAQGVGSRFRPLNAPECEPASWRNRLPTPFWQRPPEDMPALGQAPTLRETDGSATSPIDSEARGAIAPRGTKVQPNRRSPRRNESSIFYSLERGAYACGAVKWVSIT